MEEERGDGVELVSTYPAPPAFMALYADGVENGPPPPALLKPTYHTFGSVYSTLDSVPDLLEACPEKKVYALENTNYKMELKKVNKSLVYSFVELVDVLVINPTKFKYVLSIFNCTVWLI